jgi:CBS domain-containing protein/sporulation protein YlmC with PRC-barrel domain
VVRETKAGRFLYFSEFLGCGILDPEGAAVGRLADLKVRMGEIYPKVSAIAVRRRGEKPLRELDWTDVEEFDGSRIRLKPGATARFRPLETAQDEILLRDELLDKQVVDTSGAKIERVNDIHLLMVHEDLRLAHVDFGARGLLRRLGWLRRVDRVTNWLFASQTGEKLISWKYVQPLPSDPVRKNLKINVTSRKLHELHPSDLADIIEDLDRRSQAVLFRSLDTETAALTLEEVDDPKVQAALINSAQVERASDILEEMAPDAATDLLADLPADEKDKFIRTMEPSSRHAVIGLLQFKEGTAGSIMTKDFFAVPKETTIGRAIEVFRETTLPLESVAYLYVTDEDGTLVGVSTIRLLVTGDKEARLEGLMNRRLITVGPEDDIESVAAIFKKYKFLAVPVVDGERRIEGIITLKDMMEICFEE